MTLFPNRIKQLRKARKLSQEQLAFAVGTSQRQISFYETGENSPTADVLYALADALNTSTDYLLGRTDKPERLIVDDGDLDTDEREIIILIRRQSPEQRQRIVNAVKALSN